MKLFQVTDVPGTEFPAGRRTRVIVGPGAPAEAGNFVMGHVTIYPQGSVPVHSHEQEEVYLIVRGEGEITVDGETKPVREGSYIYLAPNCTHVLNNTGGQEMIMVFCYAPKAIVEHWSQELKEKAR